MNKILLALSGGGVRAAVFHIGVLRWLAEQGDLESVEQISSVSGGSLLVGILFAQNGYKWPSSYTFNQTIHSRLKRFFIENDIALGALKSLATSPECWPYVFSRANALSHAFQSQYGVTARMSDLPDSPVWSVNGTTAETGRRFRFKKEACGDYCLGYASGADFKIADAMAASAGFPGLIGPFAVNPHLFQWKKRAYWSAPEGAEEVVSLPYNALHIYDGGIYDNLGLEPFFDSGKQCVKMGEEFSVVVSDAGAPMGNKSIRGGLNPLRFKRIADISLEQSRALRVRAFVNYLKSNATGGAYLQIGAQPRNKICLYGDKKPDVRDRLLHEDWLNDETVSFVSDYTTGLSAVDGSTFDMIERHGYETAKWNFTLMA